MERTTKKQLVALQRRLAAWREAHGGRAHRGAPIPEDIWAAAARVAEQTGLGATARATRLHPTRLRERMTAGAGPEMATAFIELPGVALATQKDASTVLVLENGRGDRVRIEVVGSDAQDMVVGIATALWERR